MSLENDLHWLRRAFALARNARQRGNPPFGAVLAGTDPRALAEGENEVRTTRDATAHAEMVALRRLSESSGSDRQGLTLYASTEPCPMCASAAAWAGVDRIVFGMSIPCQHRLQQTLSPEKPLPSLSCRQVTSDHQPSIDVTGPLLEEEIAAVWSE